MQGNTDQKPVAKSSFGEDPAALLQVPAGFVAKVERLAPDDELPPSLLAELTAFLRTFFLGFLSDELEIEIQRFSAKERGLVSDVQVELELNGEREEVWPLLFEFVDLCDKFEDIGLMSVPEEAGENEADILDRTSRVLQDLSNWGTDVSRPRLAKKAGDLACKLDQINKSR